MDQALVDLLTDAKVVALHGAREGVLKDNTLFNAIGKAAANPKLDWASPETENLQAALNKSIADIRPLTLFDLTNKVSMWTKWSVLAFAILLMYICASLTTWQSRTSAVINEAIKDKARLQTLAIYDLVPLISALDSEDEYKNLLDAGSVGRLALRQKIDDIMALQTSMTGDIEQFKKLEGDYLFFISKAVDRLFSNTQAAPQSPVPVAEGKDVVELQGDSLPDAGNVSDAVISKIASAEPFSPQTYMMGCIDRNMGGIDASFVKESDISNFVPIRMHDFGFIQSIRCILQLDTPGSFGTYGLSETRSILDVFGVWLLPALYGMLGAVIYHLRAYLNNTRSDPTTMKVVMRVCLGGFAGIAIGWFWSPETAELIGVPSVPLGALTIAFLVGFSIDVFLALLDRIVTLMNGWVGNLGTPR